MGAFVNRINEYDLIHSFLNKKESIFLYSMEGVGKTALCSKVISKENLRSVKVNLYNKQEFFTEGQGINSIAEAIDENSFRLNYISFNSFNRKRFFSNFLRGILGYIINFNISIDIKSVMQFFISIPICLFKILTLILPKKIRTSLIIDSENRVSIMKNFYYIKEVLSKNNLIIQLTNFQTIDKISFDYLIKIINSSQCGQFICEYTEKEQSGLTFFENNLTKIQHAFHPIRLSPLPIEELRTLINNQDKLMQQKIIEKFEASFGNIRVIKEESEKYIHESFSELGKYEKAILHLARYCTLKKKDVISILRRISSYKISCIKKLIKGLIKRNFLELDKKRNFVLLYDYDEGLIDETIKIVCFQELDEFYTKKSTKNDFYLKLIDYYIKYNPKKLENLHHQLRSYIIKYSSKFETIRFLSDLEHNLQENNNLSPKMTLIIVDLYYSLSLYLDAHKMLIRNFKNRIDFVIYQAMLLNRMNLFHESNEIINQALTTKIDRLQWLTLKHIQFLNYASLRERIIDDIYIEIINHNNISDLHEYNYILRNSHIAFSVTTNESISNIIKSIKYFKKKKDYVNIGRSYISLALFADLKKAEKYLNKAEKYLQNRAYDIASIYNNKATVQMQKKKFIEAEALLNNALMLTDDSFDKLSILGNILTLKRILGLQLEQSFLDEIFELMRNEKDRILLSCLYEELSYYYNDKNIPDSADYMQKSLELSKEVSYPNDDVRTKSGYLINQLAFWHFDLSSIIIG